MMTPKNLLRARAEQHLALGYEVDPQSGAVRRGREKQALKDDRELRRAARREAARSRRMAVR